MTLLHVGDDMLRDMCEVLKELSDQPSDYNYGRIAESVRTQLELARSSAVSRPSVDACDNPYGERRPLPLMFYNPTDTAGAIYSRPQTDYEMYVCEFANEGLNNGESISPTNPSVASRGMEALNGYWPALNLLRKFRAALSDMAHVSEHATNTPEADKAIAALIKELDEFLTPREGPKIVRI